MAAITVSSNHVTTHESVNEFWKCMLTSFAQDLVSLPPNLSGCRFQSVLCGSAQQACPSVVLNPPVKSKATMLHKCIIFMSSVLTFQYVSLLELGSSKCCLCYWLNSSRSTDVGGFSFLRTTDDSAFCQVRLEFPSIIPQRGPLDYNDVLGLLLEELCALIVRIAFVSITRPPTTWTCLSYAFSPQAMLPSKRAYHDDSRKGSWYPYENICCTMNF